MKKNDLLFYYNPMSRGRIVHWLLEELGVDYEVKLLKWETKDHKSPEYLEINPMGQIPAIVHQSTVVTETPAICMYLADRFPEKKLAPSLQDPNRGTYDRWFFFAASSLEYALMDHANPRAKEVSSSHIGYGTYEDTLNTLEKALEKKYILGETFSAIDIFLSSQIGWALYNKNIDPRQKFLDYCKRCTDRPAYHRMNEKAGPI